jgi:hypothetical protein
MRRHRTRSGLSGMAGRLRPYAKRAKKKAGPVVEETWDHVAPAVEQARERMGPVVDNAREKASATIAQAMTASEPYRKEAQKRGSAAWLALRGELEPAQPKKKHWFRRILLIGGVGGAVVAAYRVLRNGSGSGWQPTPATMPPSRTADDAEPTESAGKATSSSTEGVRPVVDVAQETADTGPSDEQAGKHSKPKSAKEPTAPGAKKTSSRSTSGSRSNAKPTGGPSS